ncbi:MAG TPA: hypothetical protein VF788_19160 [Pseudonocardiaceae bacterium]
MLTVSPLAARSVLEELANAEIVTRKNVEQATIGYAPVARAGWMPGPPEEKGGV